jgi:hypothetical protein
VIELLLGAGANPNAAGLWGFTPLYEAISTVALIEDLALPSIRLLLCVANSKDPKDGDGQHASAFLRRVIKLSEGSHPAAEAALHLLNEQS